MTPLAPDGYRFGNAAQWATCLFAQADEDREGIRPLAPYGAPKEPRFASEGAAVTAATAKFNCAGEIPPTPAKAFLTITLMTPPSIAPSIIGRNHHAPSSRP